MMQIHTFWAGLMLKHSFRRESMSFYDGIILSYFMDSRTHVML